MRTFIFLLTFMCSGIVMRAQLVSDTMKIGTATYVHANKVSDHGYVHARIIQDTVLAVFDSLGNKMNYPVLRWTFSMTRKGTYCEVKIPGNTLPLKCRKWIKEQPATGWICIEGVVVLMPDGTERTLVGEKWIKL